MTIDWLDIIKESITITLVVTALMLAIEALDFLLKGKVQDSLRKTRAGQIIGSAVLGAIPGCAGGYFSVSMYSRGMFSFGALLAMMVATAGDEAFLMLALFPGKAVAIIAVLLVLGIAAGFVTDAVTKAHKGEVSYLSAEIPGAGHGHGDSMKEHLLHILPHSLKVFAWTFGVLLAVAVLEQYVDLGQWIKDNTIISILIAIVIGFIPQSGPHMVFVTMFADGLLPLPVLIANCIMQEGHAGLPLLSVSKSSWVKGKLIKLALAVAAAGITALL